MAYPTVRVRFEFPERGGSLETVVEAPGDQIGPGSLRLSPEDIRRILAETQSMAHLPAPGSAGGSRLRQIGVELFQGLFSGSAERVYREARTRFGSICLRLVFKLDRMADLARLPWELLHEPGGSDFLLLDPQISLARTVELIEPALPLLDALPLHVLVASAAPRGTLPLDFGEELQAIRSAGGKRRWTVETLEQATLEGLRTRFSPAGREEGEARPSILHFIGHGAFDRDGRIPGLELEHPDWERHFVTAGDLATAVHGCGVRLVVLNACDTGHLPEDQPFEGIATRLLQIRIPAVVAMQRPISNRAAIDFGQTFYSQLAATGRVDRALTEARRALRETEPNSATWAVPVLYQRESDPLFPLPGPSPELVLPVLERRQRHFFNPIQALLAGGQLIPRRETQEVLERLGEENTRVVVIHGVAGSGKSGVLYEVARALEEKGRPFLPLRLDRDGLQRDPRRLWEDLGLPDSPGACLEAVSGDTGGLLLIDQLDAIRWTSAHSAEALEACRDMIDEALASPAGLKVVVCCRTFDLKHDPQLRGWEQETQNLRRVEVGQLAPEDVAAAIERATTSQPEVKVRAKEKELLRHVLHLQMWLAIYREDAKVPEFDNTWALMEHFWASLRGVLIHDKVDRAAIEQFERRFVEASQFGAVLSAPTHLLEMSDIELKLYQDHHLIQVTGGRFTFCHQSYQDYLVAKHILRQVGMCDGAEAAHKVLSWLGAREKQSLFRREQTRLLLVALRGEKYETYLPVLEMFLPLTPPERTSSLRFHLRHLALQFLGQVTDPRSEEVELVLHLIEEPYWREHVLAEVVRGQVPWVEVLPIFDSAPR